MPETASKRPKRPYHHGNLARTLVEAALETIQADGLEGLTLRGVGAKAGVSRTALYRHFDDKAALLAQVALEGFRLLQDTMTRAIANASVDADDTLHVMAAAHVLFAQANPAHYQTMFGGALAEWSRYPDLVRAANAALGQIADVVREEQRRERIGAGDPVELGGGLLVADPRHRDAGSLQASSANVDERRRAGRAGSELPGARDALELGLRALSITAYHEDTNFTKGTRDLKIASAL